MEICPNCGANWIAGYIPDDPERKANYEDYEPETHFFSRVISVGEVDGDDRVVAFMCPDCKTNFPRNEHDEL